MTTRNELDRSISAWLNAEAPARAPDDVLEASRDRIRITQQRRSWWPAWRSDPMNLYAKLAAGAAAVLVVAVVGYQLLPARGGSGGPTATPVSSPTPAPTEAPLLPRSGKLDPGTYRVVSGPTFLLTVPAGWTSAGIGVRKYEDANELVLDVWGSDVLVFADACESEGTQEAIGPTVADLLAALEAQANSEISDPIDATIGGLSGVRVEISAPEDLDVRTCSIGNLQAWEAKDRDLGGWLAGMTPGDPSGEIFLADTPDGRLIFRPHHPATATAPDVAELEAIVNSIRVVP
jgi:hypothetical protein